MRIVVDDAHATGAIAVRLTADESETLLDILTLAHARASATTHFEDATHLAAILRKLTSLGQHPIYHLHHHP